MKSRWPAFSVFITLGALACSSDPPNDPTGGRGGSGGSGGTGGAGGSGAGTAGDAGPCPKFDYTNYNPSTSPTLKNDIQPILTISCALSSSCHTNGSSHHPNLGLGFAMLDGGKPSDAVLQGILEELKKDSAEVAGRKVMVPGKPEESYVMNKIEGTQNCSGFVCMGPDKCGIQMPDPLAPLEPAKVELIRAWIKKGAPL
jgi:hypothetical protein